MLHTVEGQQALHSQHEMPVNCMQAMQNVTGRFIRNAIVQMRKRAAGLCVEELKEYKVNITRQHIHLSESPLTQRSMISDKTLEGSLTTIPALQHPCCLLCRGPRC